MAFGNVLGQGVNLSDYPTREEVSQEIENSGVQMATGSYVGTGTASPSKNTLTFGFKPSLVIVTPNLQSAPPMAIFVRDALRSRNTNTTNREANITVEWGDNTLTWTASDASYQLNVSGTTYQYIALGTGGE